MFSQTTKNLSNYSQQIPAQDELKTSQFLVKDDYYWNSFYEEEDIFSCLFQSTQDQKDYLIDLDDSTLNNVPMTPEDENPIDSLVRSIQQPIQLEIEGLASDYQKKLQMYQNNSNNELIQTNSQEKTSKSYTCLQEQVADKQASETAPNQSEISGGMSEQSDEEMLSEQDRSNARNQTLPHQPKKKKHKNANFPAFLKKILFAYLRLPKNECAYSYMQENDSKFSKIEKTQGSLYNNKYLLTHEKLRKVFEEMIRIDFYKRESQLGRADLKNKRNYEKAFKDLLEVCQYQQTSTIQQYLKKDQSDLIQSAPIF